MIVRDPRVKVRRPGDVAVVTREGEPIFGARAATTSGAIRLLIGLVDALLAEPK